MVDALMMLASIGVPFTLAIVETVHPHVHDLFEIDLTRWMVVHYAQIVLFPLAAWSQATLIRGERGYAVAISRAAMFIFAITCVAFDTAAGVVTGVLVRSALASGSPEAWRPPVLAIWNHPIIGGSSDGRLLDGVGIRTVRVSYTRLAGRARHVWIAGVGRRARRGGAQAFRA